MKKYTTPLMLGLVSVGIVGGVSSTLLSQHVFAAEGEAATTETVETATTEQESKRQAMRELHDAARSAIESGDYAAWSAKMNEINEVHYAEMKAAINEENFAVLQKIETARDGMKTDREAMKELTDQLSVPMLAGPMGRMHHHVRPAAEANTTDTQTQTDQE